MLAGVARRVVSGAIGLDEDSPGDLPPSGASGDLREERKGPLGGAEVRLMQGDVRQRHAHHRDALQMQALGDHLRAQNDVDVAGFHGLPFALEVMASAGGVLVQADELPVGEKLPEGVFEALRAQADLNGLALARRADGDGFAPMAAEMARERVHSPMVR